MTFDNITYLLILFIITSLIIYIIYLYYDDIQYNFHSIISNSFEKFSNIDDIKVPTTILDMSLNNITNKINPIETLKLDKFNKYCFIGDDSGRHCVTIDEEDKCMSGEIYESRKQCQHPNLRY